MQITVISYWATALAGELETFSSTLASPLADRVNRRCCHRWFGIPRRRDNRHVWPCRSRDCLSGKSPIPLSFDPPLKRSTDLVRPANTLGYSRRSLQSVNTSLLHRSLPHPETMGPSHHSRDLLLHAQHSVGGGPGLRGRGRQLGI